MLSDALTLVLIKAMTPVLRDGPGSQAPSNAQATRLWSDDVIGGRVDGRVAEREPNQVDAHPALGRWDCPRDDPGTRSSTMNLEEHHV